MRESLQRIRVSEIYLAIEKGGNSGCSLKNKIHKPYEEEETETKTHGFVEWDSTQTHMST